ncbi:MAG: hypothetical protein B6D39_10980 [Anaerolineae bacterium UTCFX2]|jgi:hydroxypyruvate reductase|nr:glycerate kinase [Anaerolineales bacterium]OQY88800.1 MAG: hypothetical protein B6D39_10980 [Anaerolineae bacterium UTCFX2]
MRKPIHIESPGIRNLPEGEKVLSILHAALDAVDPYQAMMRAIGLQGNHLEIADRELDLTNFRNVYLIGVGKAALPMGVAAEEILGAHLSGGILVTKADPGLSESSFGLKKARLLIAAHPIPDARSIQAAQAIFDLLDRLDESDLVIGLISGGASALMASPVNNVSLADLQRLTDQLLRSGATINEINAIRKHLDEIKGGGLVRRAPGATIITLVLSDVVGDPLDVIASGSTVPDRSTFQDCLRILGKYNLLASAPAAIRQHLDRGANGDIPETLKPGELDLKKSPTKVIANNQLACQAARHRAHQLGFDPLYLGSFIQGEARTVGQLFAGIARQIQKTNEPAPRPACVIAGGETTVTVRGNGRGGRNQELALGSVDDLDGLDNMLLVSLATDGVDGLSDAAGAVVSGDTRSRALDKGLDPGAYLLNNDSNTFFSALGDLIYTGPTHTNVNDLIFLFAF